MQGMLSHLESSPVPPEEIRFGVILNGGVSLAVWMGGTVHELDRLTKQRAPAYARLLALAGCTARADVMAGTSAGGINGACLALAQVNRDADLGMLRDLWIEQGRLETLLRQPFRGSPSSLLRGDEYFLPALNTALTRLAAPDGWRSTAEAPIDLTITATVLGGNQLISVDSMGQPLPQSVYAGRFQWRRMPGTDADPFSPANLERTAHRLALAARSTASFPVAFEPSFVPVNDPAFAEPAAGSGGLSDTQRLRPDMQGVVRSWGGFDPERNRSRFVVDGGALANTPTLAALQAVEAMPSTGPVRRVMLLVYPHAPAPSLDPPNSLDEPPTTTGAMSQLLGALTGQGSRTYVDALEEHNRLAAGRRGTRDDVLRLVQRPEQPAAPGPEEAPPPPPDPIPPGTPLRPAEPDVRATTLEDLAWTLFPHYKRLRMWRAGRDLSARLLGKDPASDPTTAAPPGWSYERTRQAAQRAQFAWHDERDADADNILDRPRIPFVPDLPPREETAEAEALRAWSWGVSSAINVTESAADLVRRLVRVLEQGEDYETVARARARISRLRTRLDQVRSEVDQVWQDLSHLMLEPNDAYWGLRLAVYDQQMVGAITPEAFQRHLEAVADHYVTTHGDATPPQLPGFEGQTLSVHEQLTAVLRPEHWAGRPAVHSIQGRAAVGEEVRRLVLVVLAVLRPALRVLEGYTASVAANEFGIRTFDEGLVTWWSKLVRSPDVPRAVLLCRLLQLEVASTCLGDEVTTGASYPVELVQLSAQTRNRFAQHSLTADDKLGGWSVNRFGGFLKRSWRTNDWMWGRMDAASSLSRTVLHPARVRRTAQLSGYLETGSPGELADATVAEVLEDLHLTATFPMDSPLAQEAVQELSTVFLLEPSHSLFPAAMPALSELFAWSVHEDVVTEELPVLASSIRADRVEGASPRSNGERFLAECSGLLSTLEQAPPPSASVPEPVAADVRVRALAAFDRAGVGREPMRDESSSDLMIRTSTTAAAVLATVASSARSGLKAIGPVTKALRGGMLLPFWVVTGLTARAGIARNLALLGLSLGGTILALALFGVLPESLAGPGAAVGASALLLALAYSALRTGTLLHGIVLLAPVVPLLTYAVVAARAAGKAQDDAAAQGASTLLVVVALAVALMVLGSFGAAYGSVFAAMHRLADRRGVPAGTGALRMARGVLLTAWPVLLGLVLVAVAVWLVVLATQVDWVARFRTLPWWVAWLGVALALFLLFGIGARIAERGGRSLRLLGPSSDGGDPPTVVWRELPLSNPRGVAAGWSVMYGAGAAVVAVLLLADPFGWHPQLWHRSALLTAVGFAVVLLVPVPGWLIRREYTAVTELEVDRGASGVPVPESYAVDLAARGRGYVRFVTGGATPTLTPHGERLQQQVEDARPSAS